MIYHWGLVTNEGLKRKEKNIKGEDTQHYNTHQHLFYVTYNAGVEKI